MEKARIKGELTLSFLKNGKEVKKIVDHNLITSSGYNALLQGINGVASKNIASIQMGTNSTTEAATDTAITNPVTLAIATSAIDITAHTLTLTFVLDANTGNGITFAEFGTICADATLFSRKAIPAFAKIAELTINGTWVFSI